MFENIEDPRKYPPQNFLPDDFDICPVCGKHADDFYLDKWDDLIGCTECIKRIDPEEHYYNKA